MTALGKCSTCGEWYKGSSHACSNRIMLVDFISKDELIKHYPNRVQIDTVNIWFSPNINKWSVCALAVKEPGVLVRHKSTHDTFAEAIEHVQVSFKGESQ